MKNDKKRLLQIGALVSIVSLCSAMSLSPASAKSTKRTTKKRTTTRSRTTTIGSTRATTTRPPATVAAPPSTIPPTTAAIVNTIASSSVPGSISFDKSAYNVTLNAGTTLAAQLNINIAQGFNDTLTLRVPTTPNGVGIQIDPNPTRNYFNIRLLATTFADPFSQFTLEAVATSNPSVVLARTTFSLFINGTTSVVNTIATSTVPNNPNGAPGIAYAYPTDALQVTRGSGAASLQVDMVRQGGFTGAVTFEVSSVLPTGVGYSFQYNPTTGTSQNIFISAGTAAVPGTYQLTFDAVTSQQRTTIRVTVVIK